jgi:hypothetical protein
MYSLRLLAFSSVSVKGRDRLEDVDKDWRIIEKG